MYIAKKPVLDSMPIVQPIDANANKIDFDGVDEIMNEMPSTFDELPIQLVDSAKASILLGCFRLFSYLIAYHKIKLRSFSSNE